MVAAAGLTMRVDVGVDVLDLVGRVPVAGRDWVCPGEVALRLDRHGRPRAVLVPAADGSHRHVADALQVLVGTSALRVARQALARPPATRDVPVVVVDARGRAVGVVGVDALTALLGSRGAAPEHAVPRQRAAHPRS